MALPTKNTMINEIAGFDTFYNGGKGSGNFGHSGRPGEVGGSGDGSGGSSSDIDKKLEDIQKGIDEAKETLARARKLGADAPVVVVWEAEQKLKKLESKKRKIIKGAEDSQVSGKDIKEKKEKTDEQKAKEEKVAVNLKKAIKKVKQTSGDDFTTAHKELQDMLSKLSPKYKRAIQEEKEVHEIAKTNKDFPLGSYIRRIDEDQYLAAQKIYKKYGIDTDQY